MAVQQVVLMRTDGSRIEFQAEESVSTQIGGHFLTTPEPPRKQYSVLKGNANAGWVSATIGINWEEAWCAILVYEATEQPPP